MIVCETNRYAAQCLAAANSNSTWSTDVREIRAYFVFMVVMGINRLPEIQDYWSTDTKLKNAFVSSRITRKRFEEISRYLHFVDNTTLPLRDEPGFHRLQKVQPLIRLLRERFLSNYQPHTQNSIDEAMIPFKGLCLLTYTHANGKFLLVSINEYVYVCVYGIYIHTQNIEYTNTYTYVYYIHTLMLIT